jgi:hypothetical protein
MSTGVRTRTQSRMGVLSPMPPLHNYALDSSALPAAFLETAQWKPLLMAEIRAVG